MYNRFLEGEDLTKLPQEEDPFWEPADDVVVGSANVFLQSLSYALDFEDELAVTDYKGSEEGSMSIHVTPCSQAGKPLDDDYFVDEPNDLVGKPYHFKITIRTAEVHKTRYTHGLYVSFRYLGDDGTATRTQTVKETLSPTFDFEKIVSYESITQEHLDWFDNGCISFTIHALQSDTVSDARLSKMTTKDLRQKEFMQGKIGGSAAPQATFRDKTASELPNLKAELILYKKKHKRLEEKEKRIQDLVTEWEGKTDAEKQFEPFHRAVHAAAFHERGKLKFRVNLLHSYLKNNPEAEGGGGGGGQGVKPAGGSAGGSKACSMM